MNSNIYLPTFQSSYDKTNLSLSQKDLTEKMIKDIKLLKNKCLMKDIKRLKLKTFHHDSLMNSFNHRYSDSLNINHNIKKYNPINQYSHLNYNGINKSKRTLSLGSLSTSVYNNNQKNNSNFNTISTYSNSRNKIEFLRKFKPKYLSNKRAETLYDLKEKTKSIFLKKYFINIQKKEYKTIKEEKSTVVDLIQLEIYNYKKMITLLQINIKSTDEYIKYLNELIKKETLITQDLTERKNEILHETYLLRFRFGRVQKVFEHCIDNKFFLLCVKNGTNILEKFSEEDQRDYHQDCSSLDLISNFNSIQKKMAKKKTLSVKSGVKRYSILEENISSGIKVIREPKPIFSNPEDFKKKLDIISYKIQESIIEYNKKNNELLNIRDDFYIKKEEIEKEEEMNTYFEEEIKLAERKLSEVKLRNEYLNNYLKMIPKNKLESSIKEVRKKIKEIHKEINKREEFEKEKIFRINNAENSLTRLLDIENKINFLIQYKQYQIKNNTNNYYSVKKMIDLENRMKGYELAKIKRNNEFLEKQQKIYNKNNKILFKPLRKVVEILNFHKNS
jgi:hypothetical protein